jgi:hypothetical protein
LALPTGMVILGVMSSLLGPQRAMLVSALVGLAVLGVTAFTNRGLSGGVAVSGGREGDPVSAQSELG